MAKYNQFGAQLNAWKRCFSRSPLRRAVMEAAKCPRKKGPRGGARYRCKHCKKDFSSGGMQVDHISPIVPYHKTGREMTWDELSLRIFCDTNNLQALCTECHSKKSEEERGLRKEARS